MQTKDIEISKQLGSWKPNYYLSNLCIAYYEDANYANKRIFPVCQVDLPSGHFYEFRKEDLARDNVRRKPDYGSVAPAVMGLSEQSYSCHVDQILIGIDQIIALAYQRQGAPGSADPYRARVKTINEQINLHQELEFAQKFFHASAWSNVWTGAASANVAQKKFKKFDNADVDPVAFIDSRMTDIRREGRRKPNKLALGMETFVALKNNPAIKERIKYSGTTQNPAVVTETVLAQIFGVEQVVVLDATFNAAAHGATADMHYVCDSKGALLLYTPDTPAVDEPSALYSFTWRLDGGNYIAVTQLEGAPGTHTDLLEGLIAFDMRKTSDALAVYLADCCG